MKRLKVALMIAASSLLLVACGNSAGSGSGNKKVQLTGNANGNNYQSVIKDGHYLVSKSRGVDASQNNNAFNLKGFQSGLLDISKQQFSPDKYIFQEGQYINTPTTLSWLGRQSKQNPNGLNPAQDGKKTTPEYLQQIDEQDFMTQDGDKLNLKGMTIGLGLNSVYYYTKTKYGAQYQENIPNDVLEKQGKEMANTVLKRLRKNPKLRDIPIVIALYKQAPDDSLVGGNFVAQSVNDPGTTTVNNWSNVKQQTVAFPTPDGSKGPNSNDLASFNEFKTQVQNFFPNLSGVTAQVTYDGNTMTAMHVKINTQFYSQTEIISFTQFLQTAAQKYLPADGPIDITVSSTDGIQSYLSRSSGGKDFTTHVFGNN